MNSKIIVLMLCLATCLVLESALKAAQEIAPSAGVSIELGEKFEDLPDPAIESIVENLADKDLAALSLGSNKRISKMVQDELKKRRALIDYWTTKEIVPIFLKGHTDWVLSVAFSHDGNVLASGSRDKTIRLWDIESGQEKMRLEGHTWCSYVGSIFTGWQRISIGI